ncbi:MAG TPA: SPOR domain-containing protein [Anaeromyxobacteraceae bacterium]|nr:SPOR domain-containing protein [Anaeromyxobacteraceae bacterium]
MRENTRVKGPRFEVSLDAKQVCAILAVALVLLGAAFALGIGAGHRSPIGDSKPTFDSKDPLARLDETPVSRDEAPPELVAHQVLTDSRSLDKAIPVKDADASTPEADSQQAPSPPSIVQGGGATAASSASPRTTNRGAAADAPLAMQAKPETTQGDESAPESGATKPAASARRNPVMARTPSPQLAYTIQVASSSRRADAERLARHLLPRRARVVSADLPGRGRVYRVQLGAFESATAARRQLSTLAKDGLHGIVTAAH